MNRHEHHSDDKIQTDRDISEKADNQTSDDGHWVTQQRTTRQPRRDHREYDNQGARCDYCAEEGHSINKSLQPWSAR